jgi:phytoene desaturase
MILRRWERYFDKIIDRFETLTGQSIKTILYLNNLLKNDFVSEYNSYKEMPMDTLLQTVFETKVKRRLKFIFTGQLTVPGPGRSTCINFWKIGVGIN